MPDSILKEIADSADIIVAGYSYTIEEDKVRVLNLENMARTNSSIINV